MMFWWNLSWLWAWTCNALLLNWQKCGLAMGHHKGRKIPHQIRASYSFTLSTNASWFWAQHHSWLTESKMRCAVHCVGHFSSSTWKGIYLLSLLTALKRRSLLLNHELSSTWQGNSPVYKAPPDCSQCCLVLPAKCRAALPVLSCPQILKTASRAHAFVPCALLGLRRGRKSRWIQARFCHPYWGAIYTLHE